MVSVSVDFAVSSEKDAPPHCKGFDYSRADWDGFRDHLRDVLGMISINMVTSKAASEFSDWLQACYRYIIYS